MNQSAASFTNETGGEINIDDTADDGIRNQNTGTSFTNQGKINIGANKAIGSNGVNNSDSANFANEADGEINIDDTGGAGIVNQDGSANFTNQGKINIGTNKVIGGFGISNASTSNFTNEASGEINIDRSNGGLFNGSGTTLTNSAKIIIGALDPVGLHGIYNSATFDNKNGGDIHIDNSTNVGLVNTFSGIFTNEADLTIGANASAVEVVEFGIFNQATFDNKNGGDIQIDRSTVLGLWNGLGGTFTNEAAITIGAMGPVGQYGVYNQATFNNNTCAEIYLFDNLGNSSNFTNYGLFSVNTSLPHVNSGNLTNDGIIETVQLPLIPNVTNNEIIIAPTVFDGCDEISPAFGLGNPVDFNIVGVYTDASATNSAGTYDLGINTFSPTNTLTEGTFNYFVKIEDSQGGCTRIVPWQLTIDDVTPPEANCQGNITVQLDANGQASITTSQIDDGTSDNCGFTSVLDRYSFDCADVNQTWTIYLTATDPGGNKATCSSDVTIVDNLAPVPLCNDLTVVLDGNGQGSITTEQVGNGSSDNCTIVYRVLDDMDFDCGDLGPNTVTLTLEDQTGNMASCPATITVVDATPPTLVCKDIIISLNADGHATIAPADVYNAALSSDNCGIITLAGVSPYQFTCLNEGTNTVTLTANDGNGNTGTCTATIEVAEFLTLEPPTATAESCAGFGDGTVSLMATAGGGQVKYSIDGGATFQPSGSFGNLSPGTYTIVVKVFGVPAVCEKTATATVAAGGSPTTWFKDTDGDGYTDGTTVTSCAQPTGYINNPLPGTDCNDYDPLAFPGQAWYEDLDGDGYGSGNTQTACQRPTGCFTASELIAVDTDCNDLEATVNPAATEICDGLDNDCNGETDEGLSGTYVGNVFFTTQAQLDAWLACYDVIQGSVTIQGGNITDLTPLSNIVEITGNLMILMNAVLTSLDGLENLADVGGALYMYYNFQLSDCCAIDGLLTNNGVAGATIIFFNAAGSNCNSAAAIMAACPVAPLVGSGSSNSFVQACSDCIPQGLMTVFPNPTSTTVNVKWSGENPSGTVQLTDLLGRVLMEHKLQSRNEFNVSKQGSGIYLVRVKVDGYKQQVERVVVER